jgi:hypothetical protein
VVLNTDPFHGHPEPMTCPEGVFRRSIALYYYTVEKNPNRRATNYQASPGDGKKKWLVKLDDAMVALYTEIKGRLVANYKIVSAILGPFSGKRK